MKNESISLNRELKYSEAAEFSILISECGLEIDDAGRRLIVRNNVILDKLINLVKEMRKKRIICLGVITSGNLEIILLHNHVKTFKDNKIDTVLSFK